MGCVVAAGMAAAGVAPVLADGGHNGQSGWNDGHWNGDRDAHSYDDWQDHGWMDDDRRWHWLPGWGPGVPVYAAPSLPPEYYAPPPPPVYYAPPPPPPVYYAPPPVYVAPPPSIVITPGGIGIAP